MFNSSYQRQISHEGPICPYCGNLNVDFSASLTDSCSSEEIEDVVSCLSCDRFFNLQAEITYTFTTTKVEESE